MSTEHTPAQSRAFAGLCVSEVAKATGLSRSTIFQLAAIADLGSPRHFIMPARGDVVYTPEGLVALIEFMELTARPDQAASLRAVVAQERQKAATRARVTTPDSAEVRAAASRWDLETEQRHEAIYGDRAA